jgi:hypothetical protein
MAEVFWFNASEISRFQRTRRLPFERPFDAREVRVWHKADIQLSSANVCFRGQSGHRVEALQCPLMTLVPQPIPMRFLTV